jgi:hypothetical protein
MPFPGAPAATVPRALLSNRGNANHASHNHHLENGMDFCYPLSYALCM